MTCFAPSRVNIRKKSVYEKLRINYSQEVPCGHCLGCRVEQARQWTCRMMHESRMHDDSWFVTLTYEEVPENGSLNPQHFRRFIKDLRKDHEAGTISYYGCGEYGDSTGRPHYHAVLFGPHFLDRSRHPDPSRFGVWRSEALERYWKHGFAEIGTMTVASASYVAGYVQKKVRKKDFPSHYERVIPETGEVIELVPEFARMSLKPAIGRRWIQQNWPDVYPRDFVVFDGVEAKPPRYYDKWMDDNQPEMMDVVRQKRWDERLELSKYTLNAKKKILESRQSLYASRGAV